MAKSVNAIRRDASTCYAFLQDAMLIHNNLDTGNLPDIEKTDEESFVYAKTLKETYEYWCECNDVQDASSWLIRNLKTLLPKMPDRVKIKDAQGSYIWGYRDIKVKPGYKIAGG